MNKLKNIELRERVPVIKNYLKQLDKKERERYKQFYDESIKSLNNTKRVCEAEEDLVHLGYLPFGGDLSYNITHQIACVAAGKPIKTPKREIIQVKIPKVEKIPLKTRVPVIKNYLKQLDKKERERYKQFYDESIKALEKIQVIYKIEEEFYKDGKRFEGVSYNLAHQIACVAAGKPIKTPKMDLPHKGEKEDFEKKLAAISLEDKITKVKIIREFLRRMNQTEKEKYAKFYETSRDLLEEKGNVTKAESELIKDGQLLFTYNFNYSLTHQIARIASRKRTIKTPQMEIIDIKSEKKKQSKSEKKERRINFGIRAYQRAGNGARRVNNKTLVQVL